ncbi:uncharacterized protein [Hetaerina americana]|uniref:uncharacterized protein n=1 Tax=Hetaerina americana TaxID=62018 RepID=UPI003A7F46AC
MIIMNCCDCYWQPQPPVYPRPYLRDYLPANQVPFVPDYVYNPKEARIRKAMRDQASRARAVHHQHQRQHQQQQQHQNQQHHHHQAQSRQQYVMQMGGRNDIISRARLNSLPRQTQSSNVQQNHKISHLRIPPHILQQKPNQIHVQQVSQGVCNETCGQQWMVGMEQRHGIHHPHQQEFVHSQEQHYEKTKASIRQQVEQGLLDGVYGNFMEMETVPYPTSRVVEVTGSGCSDGFSNRSSSDERTGMGPHVTIPNGQEFTVYTDADGRQHWYPYVQADEIKVQNGGMNNWSQQHEQQALQQTPHHHMHNENHELKMTGDHQQLFPSQCLVGQESSNPLQVSPGDVGSQGEEYSQVQQYVICPPSAPQAKFIAQTKVEVEDTKENPNEIEISETLPSVMISSTANASSSNLEDLEQRNPDSLPLPAFQQAFGSTEIGRFANEGFLSQVRVSLALPAHTHGTLIPSQMPNSSSHHQLFPINHQSAVAYESQPSNASQQRLPHGTIGAMHCTYQHHQQLRPMWECQRDLPIRH